MLKFGKSRVADDCILFRAPVTHRMQGDQWDGYQGLQLERARKKPGASGGSTAQYYTHAQNSLLLSNSSLGAAAGEKEKATQ